MGSIDFTSIKTSDFVTKSFECSCGRPHRVETQKIMLGKNAITLLGEVMSVVPAGKVLFISSEDIYESYAARISGEILNLGYSLVKHIFPVNFKPELEQLVKLQEYPEDIRLIVAYGSGSVCDAAKYASFQRGIKLIMIPSAPGSSYLSTACYLYQGGVCRTYKGAAPYALLCDLNVIRQASKDVLASAFGELCSKLVALVDWYFSRRVMGSHHCDCIEELMLQCINMAINSGEGLIADNEYSLYTTSEALIRSSLCVQILGYDRCSAGSPHFAAQLYWPKRKLRYGEKCMLASKSIMNMYNVVFNSNFADIFMPPDKDLRARKISKILNADPELVYGISKYGLDIEQYSATRQRVDEFKADFLKLLDIYTAKLNMAWVIFKQIYKDSAAWMEGAVEARELASAIALAPDLTPDYSPLAYMRDMGILDRYI